MIAYRRFKGLTNDPAEQGGLLVASSVRIRRGRVITVPDPMQLTGYEHIASDLGLYAWGHRGKTLIVAFGYTDKDYTGAWLYPDCRKAVLCTVIDYATNTVTQTDISQYGVPGDRPIPAVVVGDTLWFSAGGLLFRVDTARPAYQGLVEPPYLAAYPASMVLGYEAGTASFLTDPPGGTIMAVHNGRVYYGGLSHKVHGVTQAVNYDDYPDTAALWKDPNGRFSYGQNMVLYSEPYQPNAVKVWGFLAIEDYQSSVTGLVSFNRSLLIFTRNGVWQYSGDDPLTATLERLPGMEGCVDSRSVAVVGHTLFWVGPTGINYLGPSGYGRVSGLDSLFGKDMLDPNAIFGRTKEFIGASATEYGYYVLITKESGGGGDRLIAVDAESHGATVLSGPSEAVVSVVGIGSAEIGGPYCDVLAGTRYGGLYALLWDGGSGTATIVPAPGDIGGLVRAPLRKVSVSLYDAGRIDRVKLTVYGDYHLESSETYQATLQPEGYEDASRLGSTFVLGQSKLWASGYRHWNANLALRGSMALIGVEVEFRRATALDGIYLEGGIA